MNTHLSHFVELKRFQIIYPYKNQATKLFERKGGKKKRRKIPEIIDIEKAP